MMWGMMLFSVFYLIDKDIIKYVSIIGAMIGTFAILRFKTIRD
jgi:hypothetical protein